MVYTLHKISVLLVEDVVPMLELATSVLGIFGFQDIERATDGQRGFDLFCRRKFDLVITDWLMEPVDGLELIKKIRNDPASPNPYVPVILMTGYGDRARVEMGRDVGMTEFMTKPFSARDLYARIVQVIEKPRQFVDADEFFGPDRRRRRNIPYGGVDKREYVPPCEAEFEGLDVSQVLKDLQSTLKKM